MTNETFDIDIIINQILEDTSKTFSVWVNESSKIIGITHKHNTLILIDLKNNTVEIKEGLLGFKNITNCINANQARIIQFGKIYYKGYAHGALMYD